MKERPILMSGTNILPILEGRKTQTRRIVKFDIPSWANHVRNLSGSPWNVFQWVEVDKTHHPDGICVNWWPEMHGGCSCPHGQPGDRLWVKETFGITESAPYADGQSDEAIIYRADGWKDDECYFKWKPSIFMPRRFSRILLEITDVRVERLQDISEEDAIAEGIQSRPGIVVKDGAQTPAPIYFLGDEYPEASAWWTYRRIWERINGRESWDVNPFVWVIQFRRIEG